MTDQLTAYTFLFFRLSVHAAFFYIIIYSSN